MDELNQLRKQILELEQKNRLFNETEKTGNIGGWQFDPATLKQTWTDEVFRILEIDLEQDAPEVPKGLEFIDPEFRSMAEKAIQRAMELGEPYNQEWMVTTAKGNKKWVNAVCNPKMENGKVVTVSGSFQDITSRRFAEEQLKALNQQLQANEQQLRAINGALLASEKQFRNLFNSMQEGVYLHRLVYDDQGNACNYRIIEANPISEEYLNIKREDAIGKLATDLYGTEEAPFIDVYAKVAETGEPVSFEQYFEPMKKYFFISVFSPIKGEFATVFQDITEKKLAEISLTRANEELNKVQEITHVGSWYLDIATNEVVWSKELYKMYGFDPTKPVPPYTEHMKLFTPESWEILSNSLAKTSEKGIPYELELRTVRDDKTNGWMWVRGEALYDKNKKIVGLWGAAQDISERKNTEIELQNAKEKAEENEKQYRNLFENLIDEVHVWKLIKDNNGKIINWELMDVNSSALKSWGKTKKQVVGKCTTEIFNYNSLTEFMPIVKKIFETGKSCSWESYFPPTGQYLSMDSVPLGDYFISTGRDITEKRRAEEKAEESEKQLKLIADNFVNGMIYQVAMLDEGRRQFNYISKNVNELYGCTVEEAKENADLIYGKLHPDDINGLIEKEKEALKNMSVFETESRVLTSDGNIRWAYYISQPRIINGIVCWDGIEVDITERKKAEEALRKSEEMMISSQSVARICSYSTTLNESELEKSTWICSPEFYNIFGIDETYPHTIAGWVGFIHPDHRDKLAAYHEYVVKNKTSFHHQYKIIRINDGVERWVEGTGELEFDKQGNPIRMYGAIQDITERKQIELELIKTKEKAEESEANITAIIEGNNNSIWAFDRKYQILYINHLMQQEFLQAFGVLLKPGLSLIEALPESLQPFWKPRYDRVLANEQFTIEDAVPTDNGTIYIQVSFNPIVKDGQVIGGSCFGSDITSRKLAEIELINAKEKAVESDRLKSAFLANMSHEIRTPMNGILGFTSLLQEPDLTGEEQQKFIGIIQKSGERMLNTVNDIIDISRIESGQVELSVSEVDINEQLKYLQSFFKPEAEKKGIQLIFKNDMSEQVFIIKTDLEKFNSILTNLIKNAIKFTNQGFIELGYDLKKGNGSAEVEFYVKDTGTGIPKNSQTAIFDRFVQADIENKKAIQGSGLGLAISKAYTEMLGGKIWVESEPEQGSVFYFTLPYMDALERESDINDVVSPERNPGKFKKLNIVIAEDDATSEMLLEIMIKPFAQKVLKTRTGTETVEICRNNPDIDLVLMDIQMPGMNGYEATRQIRQFNKNIIIIAQTAFALQGDKEKALEAGCNESISKPLKRNELLELLQKLS